MRDERLTAAVAAMVHRASTAPPRARALCPGGPRAGAARRARAVLAERYAEEVPAAELAAAAGFADQSHLHRWFVRSYGITPGDFALAGRAR